MDLYKIGISVTMQNGVSAVLSTITGQLLGLNKHIMGAVEGFGRLKLAIAGVGAITIGAGLIKGVAELSKHGEKYTHELEQMKIAGMGLKEQQDLIAAANRVSSEVMTTTPAENIKVGRELRMALSASELDSAMKEKPGGATHEAILHLGTVQRISAIMSSVLSKNGTPFDGEGQAYELTKAAEMLGKTINPAEFTTLLGGWTQAIIQSGGKLQGSDFFGNVKYLRGAGMPMDMDFLTNVLPTFMQEMKTGKGSGAGGGAGNPLASLFAEIVGGTMSTKSLDAFRRLHLVDESKVIKTKGGTGFRLDPGAIKGTNLMAGSPYKWLDEVFEPAAKKYTPYFNKDKAGKPTDVGGMAAFLAQSFPVRTAQQITSMMMNQRPRVEGERLMQRKTMGIDEAFHELVRFDPVLGRMAVDKQLERVLSDIGTNPVVTEVLYETAKALRFLSETVEAHPTATKVILAVAAGLGVILTIVGSLALGFAAFSAVGGLGVAIVAVGTALAGLALTFDYLSEKFPSLRALRTQIVSFFSNFFTPEMGAQLTAGLQSAQTSFSGAMGQTASNVGTSLLRLATSIGSFVTAALEPMQQMILAAVTNKIEALQQAVLAAVTNAVESMQASILAGSASVLASIGTWISTIPGTLEAALQSLKDSVSAFVVELAASIKTDILNIWLALGEGLNSLIQNIGAWFANLPGMIWGSLTGQANAAVATGAASNVAQDAGQGWPGLKPADILSAVNDNKPGKGDPLVNEITQYQRDKAAGRLDANGQPTGPVVARVPPSGLGTQSTRGSNSDPIHVVVDNQINEASISRGVSSNLAGKMNRPASGYTGTDGRMDLLGIYAGVGQQ